MCMGTTHPQIISGCHFSVDIFQKGLCINHLQLPISKCHFSFAVDWAKDKIAFIQAFSRAKIHFPTHYIAKMATISSWKEIKHASCSTTLEMLSMWHTKTMSPDWSILSLKELETRVQHHNFRKSTWKTRLLFSAGYNTFIIVIAHALENVLVNLSCCLELRCCCRQKSWLQNYLWWSPKTHSHFQVKSLEKQSAAHSIFCQVSDSRLIKLSRFLLFRLTFLSIMYQFTALHWLKAP